MVKSLLRGGQLSRSVHPLDRLVSVQSQNVEQMPLSRVRELVSGPEGSKVSLGFVRRTAASGRYNPDQGFVTTMTRTSSELQDVQAAIFEDMLRLLRAGAGSDDPEMVYQELIARNWRAPDSVDGKSYVNVVDAIMAVKSQNPQPVTVRDDDQINRLQAELRTAEEAANRLRQELAHRDSGQATAVSLLVDDNPEILADAASRGMLQEQATYDIAQSLGIEKDRVEMVGMHVEDSRTLAVDVHITPPTNEQIRGGRGVGSNELANRIVQQGVDPRSPFKQTTTGQKTMKVQLQMEQEYVYRLRKTVQLLQDEIKYLQQSNAELKADNERLRKQLVASEQNVRVLKREVSEKDATIEDLHANIASLRAQLRPAIERFERAEDENAVLRRKLEEVNAHFFP